MAEAPIDLQIPRAHTQKPKTTPARPCRLPGSLWNTWLVWTSWMCFRPRRRGISTPFRLVFMAVARAFLGACQQLLRGWGQE